MRPIPSLMQTALNTGVTTFCFCWKVVQLNGNIKGFTDHDVDLTFGGVTYQHTTSFSASNIENQQGLAVSNVEVVGYLGDNTIMEDDLEAGRYDGALLTIYLVNWQDPSNQNVVIISGLLGQVKIADLSYQSELRSLMQHFSQYVGSLCQAKCRSLLGDTGKGLEGGCRFAMPAPVNATVTAVTDRTKFTVSAAGSFPPGTRGSLAGGYFAEGVATFTSGANDEVAREIIASDETIFVQVAEPFPDDIQVGDTLTLQIGCDRTLDVCIKNYNNVLNFRAEPYVPGSDSAFRVHGE